MVATATMLALGIGAAVGGAAGIVGGKLAARKKAAAAAQAQVAPIPEGMVGTQTGQLAVGNALLAAKKQRKKAVGDGRRSTIRTGPMGLMGGITAAPKGNTLLGASS